MYPCVSVDVAFVVSEGQVDVVLPHTAIGGSSCARVGTCTSSLYWSVVDMPLLGPQSVINDGSAVPSPFRFQSTELIPCKSSLSIVH